MTARVRIHLGVALVVAALVYGFALAPVVDSTQQLELRPLVAAP